MYAAVDWAQVEIATGLSPGPDHQAARMIADSPATVYCWAMGLTQHRNAVATIKEIANLAFARGDIGKPGAGLLPVRGHSNVQGDRTMGIWERPPQHFLDRLQAEFGFDPPREHGYDTVDSIRALRDGKAHVFIGLGGNFVQAAPDTEVTADALRRARLTVHVSTKINRSHLVCGETALILPTLGRTEKDVQASGEQFVSVEDSTCSVHASRGPLEPASAQLRSEVAIVTGIAERTLGDRYGIDWRGMRDDYRVIRTPHLPGGAGLRDVRGVGRPTGRLRDAAPAAGQPDVPDGLRAGRVHRLTDRAAAGRPTVSWCCRPCAVTISSTPRSTVWTTAIAASSAAAGWCSSNADDLAALGLGNNQLVDLIGHWADDDVERRANGFRIVAYDTPRGCAAAYYPETNPLVPLDSTAEGSNTPTSKSVIISLVPAGAPTQTTASATDATGSDATGSDAMDATGADDGHKEHPQPVHLS